jgi:hypothetical protein
MKELNEFQCNFFQIFNTFLLELTQDNLKKCNCFESENVIHNFICVTFFYLDVSDIRAQKLALVYTGNRNFQLCVFFHLFTFDIEHNVARLTIPEARIRQNSIFFYKFEIRLDYFTIQFDLCKERRDSGAKSIRDTVDENGAKCFCILDVTKHSIETLRYL